jgi:anti-sigma factor RsiW
MMCHVSLRRLTCKDVIVGLGEYLDAELTPAMFGEIEAHLRACEPCRAFLATYRKTKELVSRAAPSRSLSSDSRAFTSTVSPSASHVPSQPESDRGRRELKDGLEEPSKGRPRLRTQWEALDHTDRP